MRLRWFSEAGGGVGGGGGSRGAGTYGSAHFCGVQVVVDEGVNNCGKVVLEHGVALGRNLRGAKQPSHLPTELLEHGHNLVHSCLVGDELVDVGQDVHADTAGEVVLVLGEGEGGGKEGGEDEGGLHGGGGAGLLNYLARFEGQSQTE